MKKFFEYSTNIWHSFVESNGVVASITVIGAFCVELWIKIYAVVISILIISVMDTHLAIKACIKKGGKYESTKVKKGLFPKIQIYLVFFISAIIIDVISRKIYNYENFYTVFVLGFLIALYEFGSIIESMNILHPNNALIERLSRYLNLTNKKIDKDIEDKLS